MSGVTSALAVAGQRQSGAPVRSQNGNYFLLLAYNLKLQTRHVFTYKKLLILYFRSYLLQNYFENYYAHFFI